MLVSSWVLALVLSGVMIVLPSYIRRRHRRARLAHYSRTRFMECAESLLKDKDAPLEAIILIEKMYYRIDSPWVVRSILWGALSGHLRKAVKGRSGHFEAMMNKMRPDLQITLIQAAVHFSFAASYSADVLGPVYRRMMLIFSKEARKSTASVAAWEAQQPHHFWRGREHVIVD